MVLPASARFTQFLGDELFVQLSDGTLLGISLDGAGRSRSPVIIAHLPFEAVFIERDGEGYRVLGSDGRLAEGDMVPPLLREYVATVGVELSGAIPARSR